MPASLTPLSFLITSIAGWLKQYQQHAVDYLVGFFGNRLVTAGCDSLMTIYL
jgi:hypothetical protein